MAETLHIKHVNEPSSANHNMQVNHTSANHKLLTTTLHRWSRIRLASGSPVFAQLGTWPSAHTIALHIVIMSLAKYTKGVI